MREAGYNVAAALLLAAVIMAPAAVQASPFGGNITIYDGSGSGTGWHGAQEDQEVEPHMLGKQQWDLEGLFLNGTTLTMVGGFDFVNGVPNYPRYGSGDLFLDVDGVYGSSASSYTPSGNGQKEVASNFGYEYVVDLDFAAMTYSVLALDRGDTTRTVYYELNQQANPSSNPWRYVSGGDPVAGYQNLAIGYWKSTGGDELLDDTDTFFTDSGTSGGRHYAAGVDLSFLSLAGFSNFTAHFTMGCGNDNLMGRGSAPVPEPATMFLFGVGLFGLAGVARRKKAAGRGAPPQR